MYYCINVCSLFLFLSLSLSLSDNECSLFGLCTHMFHSIVLEGNMKYFNCIKAV